MMELFCDGQPLTPARWPNEGFVHAKSVLQNDAKGAVFTYDGDRPNRWKQAKDPWVFGYWKWQWADSRDPVQALDTAAAPSACRRSATAALIRSTVLRLQSAGGD